MDREAWRAAIHGVTKSRTQLSDWSDLWYIFLFTTVNRPIICTVLKYSFKILPFFSSTTLITVLVISCHILFPFVYYKYIYNIYYVYIIIYVVIVEYVLALFKNENVRCIFHFQHSLLLYKDLHFQSHVTFSLFIIFCSTCLLMVKSIGFAFLKWLYLIFLFDF